MSRYAWAYIWGIFLWGATFAGLALLDFAIPSATLTTFVSLIVLATLAQLFKVAAPDHTMYHATPVFLFAGVFLLPPYLYVFLVLIPFSIEWAKERLTNSSYLRDWYLQPFNIAMFIVVGRATQCVYTLLEPDQAEALARPAVFAATMAVLIYVALNHILLGVALVLVRGVSWGELGILDHENLLTELVLSCLGYIVAVLWKLDPWLILPALSPLALIHRALTVPQLKQEARTDHKTGLLNARHFTRLFTSELEQARRFKRPLAFIMADLDLLRDINNTYGHLAGDAVIAGLGRLIRKTIRAYDVAGRFGGDEFAIAMPESGRNEAQALGERLRLVIEAAEFDIPTSLTPVRVTMSFGIACFPADAATSTGLVHEADIAVYQAKLRGRNRIVCAGDVPPSARPESADAEECAPLGYEAGFARYLIDTETGEQLLGN